MAEHETTADVIAEMHRFAKQHEYDHPDMNTNAQGIEDYADRLEAAHKRESGDAAKLREALMYAEQVLDTAARNVRGETGMVISSDYSKAARKSRAALSAPPRNCDVGTEQEQIERFNEFCNSEWRDNGNANCGNCPLWVSGTIGHDCQIRWAQMPYEEGGAE